MREGTKQISEETEREVEKIVGLFEGGQDYWGANLADVDGEAYKERIKKYLTKSVSLVFDDRGNDVPGAKSTTGVKYLPFLLGLQQKKMRDAAVNAYRSALEGDGGELVNWSHAQDHAPFVKKILFRAPTR